MCFPKQHSPPISNKAIWEGFPIWHTWQPFQLLSRELARIHAKAERESMEPKIASFVAFYREVVTQSCFGRINWSLGRLIGVAIWFDRFWSQGISVQIGHHPNPSHPLPRQDSWSWHAVDVQRLKHQRLEKQGSFVSFQGCWSKTKSERNERNSNESCQQRY